MANLNLKKSVTKKDMNFFAEFTASSRKVQRYLGYAVIAAIAVLAIMIFYTVFLYLRNNSVNNEIKTISNKLNSPDYLQLQENANALALQIESRTSYYYALTSMRTSVNAKAPAAANLTDLLDSSKLPNDMLISNYVITGSEFIIKGQTFSYYRALEFINMINNSADVFRTTEPTIQRYFNEDWKAEDLMNNAVQNYYTFEIAGSLIQSKHIIVKNLASVDGTFIPLTGITDTEISDGSSTATIPVDVIVVGNSTYQPSSILVNGIAISDTEFANAVASKSLVLNVINDNNTVEIDYELLQTATEADGGEA